MMLSFLSTLGLQAMDATLPEVKELLSVLEKKFEECQDEFNGQAIGYSLVGIASMPPTVPEVAAIITQISIKIAFSEFRGQPNVEFLLFGNSVRVRIKDDIDQFTNRRFTLLPVETSFVEE